MYYGLVLIVDIASHTGSSLYVTTLYSYWVDRISSGL